MVCLETSSLIDLLEDEIPEDVLEEVDESQEVTVSAVAAAEVWVGAHYEGDDAVETARELLGSLVWLGVSRTVAYGQVSYKQNSNRKESLLDSSTVS